MKALKLTIWVSAISLVLAFLIIANIKSTFVDFEKYSPPIFQKSKEILESSQDFKIDKNIQEFKEKTISEQITSLKELGYPMEPINMYISDTILYASFAILMLVLIAVIILDKEVESGNIFPDKDKDKDKLSIRDILAVYFGAQTVSSICLLISNKVVSIYSNGRMLKVVQRLDNLSKYSYRYVDTFKWGIYIPAILLIVVFFITKSDNSSEQRQEKKSEAEENIEDMPDVSIPMLCMILIPTLLLNIVISGYIRNIEKDNKGYLIVTEAKEKDFLNYPALKELVWKGMTGQKDNSLRYDTLEQNTKEIQVHLGIEEDNKNEILLSREKLKEELKEKIYQELKKEAQTYGTISEENEVINKQKRINNWIAHLIRAIFILSIVAIPCKIFEHKNKQQIKFKKKHKIDNINHFLK